MPVIRMTPGQSPEAPGTLEFYKQGAAPSSGFTVTSEGMITGTLGAEDLAVDGDLTVGDQASIGGDLTVDGGLSIAEGPNGRMGVVTLVDGVAVVANTSVTADTRIWLTSQNSSGTPGAFRISARTPGVSFTITCTQVGNTSSVAYLMLEPA